MKRRAYIVSGISFTSIMTSECISNNSIEYEFEYVDLHDEFYNNPHKKIDELPRVRENETDVIIESFIS